MFRLQKNKGNSEGLPFTLLVYYKKIREIPKDFPYVIII